jgi:hypothetical protein
MTIRGGVRRLKQSHAFPGFYDQGQNVGNNWYSDTWAWWFWNLNGELDSDMETFPCSSSFGNIFTNFLGDHLSKDMMLILVAVPCICSNQVTCMMNLFNTIWILIDWIVLTWIKQEVMLAGQLVRHVTNPNWPKLKPMWSDKYITYNEDAWMNTSTTWLQHHTVNCQILSNSSELMLSITSCTGQSLTVHPMLWEASRILLVQAAKSLATDSELNSNTYQHVWTIFGVRSDKALTSPW